MKIISFSQPTIVSTGTVNPKTGERIISDDPRTIYAMNPGERCIVNDDMAASVMGAKDNKLLSISDFDPFYKANVSRPAHFRDKNVLFYRNRGIGDQLAVSCLSRFFSEKLRAKCFQLSDRLHEPLWVGNPYIYGMPIRFPLSIDSLIRFKGRPFYDYFIPMESVAEWNQEPEQLNFYDEMFVLAGFDPDRVPNEYKRPVWGIVPEDLSVLEKWKKEFGIEGDYIVFQLRATNAGRTPPNSAIDIVLERLNDIGLPIVCVDDEALPDELIAIGAKYPNAKNLACTIKGVRLYGAVLTHAKLVVGPDSSAIHFAATNNTPCIGLWGPFSPESRAKYYANHYPIYKNELCDHSPCFNFMPTLPAHKCPKGGLQLHCEVFEGITIEEVDRVTTKVVKDHKIV
jgi:ADP-heptose:LPS heptosyltransferase